MGFARATPARTPFTAVGVGGGGAAAAALAARSSAPAPGARQSPMADDESTVIMERPSFTGLDGAVQARRADLAQEAAPALRPEPPPPGPAPAGPTYLPEWYVGIDGEPVGPIDVRYLKSQIDSGKVTATSLVWREELTDWKPLNSFPQLRELISAKSEPTASVSQVSDPVALTRVKEEARAAEAPPAGQLHPGSLGVSEPSVAASPREPVLAIDAPRPLAEASAGLRAAETRPPVEVGREHRGATAHSGSGPVSARAPTDSELAELAGIPVKERRRRRRGVHPMVYAFVAMAASFGGVAAWVLFTHQRQNTQPDPVSTSSSQSTSSPPSAVATTSAAPPEGGAVEIPQVDIGPGGDDFVPGVGGTARPASSTNAKIGDKPCSPNDPFCGGSEQGPSSDGPRAGGDGSGQGLTEAQAQAVVNANRGGVSRKCMSFVSTKGGNAKVGVTIVVSPSGSVQSAAVSGGNEFPGLAACVRSRVLNWRFPQSGASTTVRVSFNFIAQ